MKVSFGDLEILKKVGKRPQIEYLVFEKAGRPHRHKEFETFVVIAGSGSVWVGYKEIKVVENSLVTIPPDMNHYMVPDQNSVLEGLLWYHNGKLVF